MAEYKAIIKKANFYNSSPKPSRLKLILVWQESGDKDQLEDMVDITGTKEEICKQVGLQSDVMERSLDQLENKTCIIEKGLLNKFIQMF